MVAYSFQRQFRAPILDATKRQTIRADRKRNARPGEQLQLFTGMRTRQCRIIGTALCELVEPIRLHINDMWCHVGSRPRLVSAGQMDDFARADGFADWPAMREFWLAHHPGSHIFNGVLIRWNGFVAGPAA